MGLEYRRLKQNSWARKLDNGHSTRFNLADGNYTEENIRPKPHNVQNQQNILKLSSA